MGTLKAHIVMGIGRDIHILKGSKLLFFLFSLLCNYPPLRHIDIYCEWYESHVNLSLLLLVVASLAPKFICSHFLSDVMVLKGCLFIIC